MNAITLYYLGQYLVVFVISYFRIRKAFQIQDPSIPDLPKFNWRPVFFVSLEIVYTSAGLIILLITDSKEWAPAIIIFYVILILISSNLNSIEERFSETFKLISHSLITLLVIAISILVLNSPTESKYRISIPFYDFSIVSESKIKIQRNFYTEIKASSENEALKQAKEEFWSSNETSPFKIVNSQSKESIIEIKEQEIIIKLEKK